MAKGGYRPGAGRPSMVDEALRKRVIEKSWDIVEKFYDSDSEDLKDKLKDYHPAFGGVYYNIPVTGAAWNTIIYQDYWNYKKSYVENLTKSLLSHYQYLKKYIYNNTE
jgi:hypothetical protein